MSDNDDEARRDALQQLVAMTVRATDPVPESSLTTAASYLRWRVSGDVAFLVEDEELVPVRATEAAVRPVVYRSRDHEIEVTVTDDAIVGSITPWTGGAAMLESPAGSVTIDVDDHGWFHAERQAAHRARLRFEPDDSGPVTTSWFRLSRGRSS